MRGARLVVHYADELLIRSTLNTDRFGSSKRDGTYSKLFEHIRLLTVNALTSLDAHQKVLVVERRPVFQSIFLGMECRRTVSLANPTNSCP